MSKKDKSEEIELTGTEKLEHKVGSFLGKNKRALIAIGIAILVALVILIIVHVVFGHNLEKQFDRLDQLETLQGEVRAMDEKSADYQGKVDDLKSQLKSLAKGRKYPALKAKYILAQIAFDEKDYEGALDFFTEIANASQGTYLGSLATVNAAVAAEEKGDDSLALEYYTKVWDDYGVDAAEAPKALFNQARLQAKSGDKELAKATFQQLIDQFPVSEYGKLAKTAIVSL